MKIGAMVIRIGRQLFRDKRSLVLMFVAPLFILTLMDLVFGGETYHPKIAVVDIPQPLVQKLEQADAVLYYYDRDQAERELNQANIDAILTIENQKPKVKLEGSDPTINQTVLLTLQKALQSLAPWVQIQNPSVTYLHGSENMSLIDFIGPVLIGLFAFFFVFLIAGIAFLRERTRGTLERLLATPVKIVEIVTGYLLGFGLFAVLQVVLIVFFSVYVLDIMLVGSFGYVLLITLLLSLTALSLGVWLSAFAKNEFQMMQFIPLVIVPQVFFSGLFHLETMNEWVRWISVVIPLKYGADALREIMIRGQGWSAIANDLYILLAFFLLFLLLNIWTLRKYRQT